MAEGVSAVLIVKNEQDLLARCLKSLVGIDEIVVLDTGSTDKTVEIAKASGAKVESIEPMVPFHFALARNKANALASNDWILAIDADEIIRAGSMRKIRQSISSHPEATGFLSTFVNRPEADVESFMRDYSDKSREIDIRTVSILKKKLFRKSAWVWKYRVHEQLVETKTPVVLDLSSVVLEHMPQADKSKRHGQNIELLKLCVQENPEYTRAFRHLGLELRLRKQWREAIPYLAEYIEKTKEDELEKSQAMMNVAICYAEIGCLGDALHWFDVSATTDPRRREPLVMAAWYLIKTARIGEDLLKAATYLEKAILIPKAKKPNTPFDAPSVWGSEPNRMLTFCREEVARAVREGQSAEKR